MKELLASEKAVTASALFKSDLGNATTFQNLEGLKTERMRWRKFSAFDTGLR